MRRNKIKGIKKLRSLFRKRLAAEMLINPALAMLAVETYAASKHRSHIYAIWALLGFQFKDAWDEYNKTIGGKHLTGTNEIFRSLYFACRPIHSEFYLKIPERLAMGDALRVAYATLRRK